MPQHLAALSCLAVENGCHCHRPRVGHSVFQVVGTVANPVGIAPYQVSGLPRVIITSASLVPNAWEKILIDDSVVNVTKTCSSFHYKLFSASNDSDLVVIILPSVDNCRPKLQTDRYRIKSICRQRELSPLRCTAELAAVCGHFGVTHCLPLVRLMEPANIYERSNRNLAHWLPR
jgi:hypothetical protein